MTSILNHLKSWWIAHLTLVAAVVTFFDPSIQAWLGTHAKYALIGGTIWGYILKASRSPLTKAVVLLLSVTLLGSAALAQTPAPTAPTNQGNFSITAQPIALPGNHQTVAGTLVGGTFAITDRLSLRQTNYLAPGGNVSSYLGGLQYHPDLTNLIKKTKLDPTSLQFYVTASAGIGTVTPAGATQSQQHFNFTAGGGLNYKVNGSFMVNLFEVQYARFPGYANNTAIFSAGPKLTF